MPLTMRSVVLRAGMCTAIRCLRRPACGQVQMQENPAATIASAMGYASRLREKYRSSWKAQTTIPQKSRFIPYKTNWAEKSERHCVVFARKPSVTSRRRTVRHTLSEVFSDLQTAWIDRQAVSRAHCDLFAMRRIHLDITPHSPELPRHCCGQIWCKAWKFFLAGVRKLCSCRSMHYRSGSNTFEFDCSAYVGGASAPSTLFIGVSCKEIGPEGPSTNACGVQTSP